MPITAAINPDTLQPELAVSEKPDNTVDGLATWSMDREVLDVYPEFARTLLDAGFSYAGTVTKKGKDDTDAGTTLHYTRPLVVAPDDTPIQKAAEPKAEPEVEKTVEARPATRKP
jgi:hypothetical protein